MTTVDTIRALFTYIIALIVVVGGGGIIFVARDDPASLDTVAIIAGFVGSALTFVFGSEIQTRTARQSQASALHGATMHANGTGLAAATTRSDESQNG